MFRTESFHDKGKILKVLTPYIQLRMKPVMIFSSYRFTYCYFPYTWNLDESMNFAKSIGKFAKLDERL